LLPFIGKRVENSEVKRRRSGNTEKEIRRDWQQGKIKYIYEYILCAY
jgi:hypothetical protein